MALEKNLEKKLQETSLGEPINMVRRKGTGGISAEAYLMAGNKFIIGLTEQKSKSYLKHMQAIQIGFQRGSIHTAAQANEKLNQMLEATWP